MCPFHPRVTAVARKRPWSFCQNCRRQVTPKHAHTLDPKKSEWADRPYMLCRHSVGTYQRKRTTRNSSGNTRPQSPQLVETLWTDPGLTSGSSKCELIFTLKEEEEEEERKKERKKGQSENDSSNLLASKTSQAGIQKSHHYHKSLRCRCCFCSKCC